MLWIKDLLTEGQIQHDTGLNVGAWLYMSTFGTVHLIKDQLLVLHPWQLLRVLYSPFAGLGPGWWVVTSHFGTGLPYRKHKSKWGSRLEDGVASLGLKFKNPDASHKWAPPTAHRLASCGAQETKREMDVWPGWDPRTTPEQAHMCTCRPRVGRRGRQPQMERMVIAKSKEKKGNCDHALPPLEKSFGTVNQ